MNAPEPEVSFIEYVKQQMRESAKPKESDPVEAWENEGGRCT